MKIAIVHDELIRRGGAEQVVKCFHLAFPQAPIYTMVYQADLTYPEFKECTIITSWYQKFVSNEQAMKWFFFPFGLLAMKQLNLRKYDVVLISSTYAAKYVKISPHALVINYCHTPFRLAWEPSSYAQYNRANGIKKIMYDWLIALLKKIDYKAAQRTDFFIANTNETRDRIKRAYRYLKPIDIIQPPVDCSRFYISDEPKGYYLVVARLEAYKKVDLVIRTFNELGFPLIIVGRGSMERELRKMAGPHIVFRSGLNSEELAKLYAGCKALVFPQHEDYGITPLEANASGRPVIAYAKGGVLETMIPYEGNSKQATAVFFNKQTENALSVALREFEKINFDTDFIRTHAEKFGQERFVNAIQDYVATKRATRKIPSSPSHRHSSSH
jgi:glycosyltransferase involved in cell wall biosynthesis